MMARAFPRIGVFHPGTQHSFQTALAFQESGQLAWYATSVFYDPSRWPYKIEQFLPPPLAARVGREFRRRFDPRIDPRMVRQFGLDEWLETLARRLRFVRLTSRINRYGNRRFGLKVIRLLEREPVDAVWGYDTSALEVFRWAKRRGIRCILDQTIGHPRSLNRVMAQTREQYPDYFLSAGPVHDDAAIAGQDEEISLADVVVCGSEFCAETLRENGCVPEKVRIIPYGFNETLFPDVPPSRPPLVGRPLNFLFVGSLDPRKGLPYLLEAFARIPESDASLTLVGQLAVPARAMEPFSGRVRHIDQLPRTEVVSHFRAADCFIFPSLFEGGGIVLYEAAAAGLGIVQTRFCGDGVRDGKNGISLDAVTVDGIVEAVKSVVADRNTLLCWQNASWEMRRDRTWSVYRNTIREMVIS